MTSRETEKMGNSNLTKWLAGTSVVVGFACIMIFVAPIVTVATEQQPADTVKTYTEQEPYTTSVPVEYEILEAKFYNWFWMAGSDIWVTIKNTDAASGDFSVEFDLFTANEEEIIMTGSGYIAAGQEGEVMVKINGGHVTYFRYTVTPPSKKVTEYRDVVKTRLPSTDMEKKKVTVFEYLTQW
jgi:hypothetical protein